MIRWIASLLALALPHLCGWAQPAPSARAMRPYRTDRAPLIDGRLDEPMWEKALQVTNFVTFIPDFGRLQAERTVAYMAYDHDNLYFAFKCYDDHPELIKAAVSRRDDVASDDFVCINLDTFGDQQSLYAFYVNPYGIQGDSRFANNKEDFSIDLQWESAGHIEADGYTVEVRIPLKSIRYTSGDVVRMAVLMERCISRRQEHGGYPALDPKMGYTFLPQLAPLEYEGLAHASVLEVLPAFTYARRSARINGDMVREPDERKWSLTTKIGLTSSLVLDATLNPDFSQVEADAGQVDANLRYNLYFPEKRPFFLEGIEEFNVGATQNSPLLTLLYTRSIVDPKSGVKLTGKLASKDTVALLHAEDKAGPSPDPDLPPLKDPSVSALRYKHALWGDGYLGLFATERDQGPRRNRVGGSDGQFRVSPSGSLSFHAFASSTHFDQTAPSDHGQALGLEYRHDTSTLGLNAGAHTVSRDFQADAGYLTRTGFASGLISVSPKFYPGAGWIRRVDPLLGFSALRDFPSGLTEQDHAIGVTTIFSGNGSASATYDDASEIFLGQRFRTSGLTLTAQSQLNRWLAFSAKHRSGQAIWYTATPAQGRGSQSTFQTVLQPLDTLNVTLSWTHANLYREDTGEELFDYPIARIRITYQPNEHFFLRAITERNAYKRQILTDYLASYTYVPGTVVYLGYGSLYKKVAWESGMYRDADHYLEMQRGLFFKASYLYRF
jgi:hypothetical protein